MKNRLVVIGWTGIQTCYLNVSREEAMRRWLAGEGPPMSFSVEDISIKEFEFDDEFGAYSVYAND